MTVLVNETRTTQGCNGTPDAGYAMVIPNASATALTVQAGLFSATPGCVGWLSRLYGNNSPTLTGATQVGTQVGPFSAIYPATQTINWTITPGAFTYYFAWFNMNNPPCCGTWQCSVSDNFAGGYCAYGTQLQPGVANTIIVSDTVIGAILEGTPYGWLTNVLAGLSGLVLYPGNVCNGLPPAIPQSVQDFILNDSPFGVPLPSTNEWIVFLEALAWNQWCECTSGSPAPNPPPLVTVGTPAGGAPSIATYVCDNGDLCTILSQIQSTVNAITSQLQMLRSDVTLIQRQKVPFAYVPGVLTTGLTGAGTLSVSGILALSVEITTLPPNTGATSDDPIEYFRIGWIATGTTDGWRHSFPIAHNPFWIDAEPDDTLIGYSFLGGAVGNIQTWLREP